MEATTMKTLVSVADYPTAFQSRASRKSLTGSVRKTGRGVQRKFHALMSDDQFMCDLTRLKELRSFLIQEAVLWMVPGSAGYESVPHNLED
jgi:hypothetical protein